MSQGVLATARNSARLNGTAGQTGDGANDALVGSAVSAMVECGAYWYVYVLPVRLEDHE